jgi:hypothetical protein
LCEKQKLAGRTLLVEITADYMLVNSDGEWKVDVVFGSS